MPRAYTAPLFGGPDQAWVCSDFPDQGRFALQMRGAMCCVLWSGATVSRAVRWATRSPVFSRSVPCSGRLKAVFSNKQDSTLDSLPGLAGEAALKLVELLLAVLTQADMHRQYSGYIGPLVLLCRSLTLSVILLAWLLVGRSASRSCCLFFWPDGAWSHSPQKVGLCLSLLAWTWEVCRGATPGYSRFPKQSLLLGRAWSYPQPWLWINLPASVQHRTPLCLVWLCSGGRQLGLTASWLERWWAPSSRESSPVLWSVGAGRHCPQWVGCGSAPCLNVGKPGSRVNKTHLRIWIREIWTPLCPRSGCTPAWFCRWTKPLVCITAWALQVWTQSAMLHGLTVASPSSLLSQSHSQYLGSADSPEIPMRETRVRFPRSDPEC